MKNEFSIGYYLVALKKGDISGSFVMIDNSYYAAHNASFQGDDFQPIY